MANKTGAKGYGTPFSQELRRRGFTITTFAQAHGLPFGRVANWNRGATRPTRASLQVLADCFGWTLEQTWLLMDQNYHWRKQIAA